jgi:hypothetical protein
MFSLIGRALAGDSGLLTVATAVLDAESRGDRLYARRRTIEDYFGTQRGSAS